MKAIGDLIDYVHTSRKGRTITLTSRQGVIKEIFQRGGKTYAWVAPGVTGKSKRRIRVEIPQH